MVMNKKPVSIDGFIRRSRSTNGVAKKRPDVSYYQPKVATKRSLNSVGSTKKQLSANVSKLANRELNHQRSERQRITQKSKTVDKQDFDVTDFLNQPSTLSRSVNATKIEKTQNYQMAVFRVVGNWAGDGLSLWFAIDESD